VSMSQSGKILISVSGYKDTSDLVLKSDVLQ
jgi:hypothetical protein